MADRLVSGNGRFTLLMQDDGNLVLYHDGTPVWATNTVVDPTPPDPPHPPLPPEPPRPPLPPVGPLTLRGRFLYAGDAPFRWQGVTAFAIPALLATGQEDQARAWLTARKAQGFNEARMLAMCSWLNLGPARGLDVLPRALELAGELELVTEVVALVDTKVFGFDVAQCEAQARAVAEIVAGYPLALVQAANEHYHDTQIDWLHDVDNIMALTASLPVRAIATASPAASDEALRPTGEYVTRHLDRSRDTWNMVRRVRELENVSRDTNHYVVNDEPIGAAEVAVPGKRLTDPAVFFTFGVLGRIFEVGSTFHCEAGLRCDPFGPVQDECARAFILGSTVIPTNLVLTFKNAGWTDSPVKGFDGSACVRAYSGVTGAQGWCCALGLTGDPKIEWQNGWRPIGVAARYPGVDLYYLERV